MQNLKDILPIHHRKKIKYFAERFIFPKVKSDIIKNVYFENSIVTKSDIFVFSVIGWGYRFQRPQQLSTHLAKLGHRIFYINNEFILSQKGQHPVKISKISDNIFDVTLSSINNYFIYENLPNLTDINQISKSLTHLMSKVKSHKPTFLIHHPFWTDIVKNFDYLKLYDCMDFHSGFTETSNNIISKEKELIRSVDKVIISSRFLKIFVSRFRKDKIYIINNAVNYEQFKTGLNRIKHNQICLGYYGALESWLDTELIEKIASKSEYQIKLAGKINNNDLIKLSKKYSNIKLIGEIPYEKIPHLLNSFDICMIPFKINDLIRATDPVKLYEYFASGKPVIATNIPELQRNSKLVYICNTKNVLGAISQALREPKELPQKRISFAMVNTWESRAKEFEKLII